MANNPTSTIEDKIISLSVDVLTTSESNVRAIIKILERLEKDLIKELILIDPTGVNAQSYRAARLRKLVAHAKELIDSYYQELYFTNRNIDKIIAKSTTSGIQAIVNTALQASMFDVKLTEPLLIALVDRSLVEGAYLKQWYNKQVKDVKNKYINTMQDGIMRGETVQQLTTRVKEVTNTSSRHAQALARTSSNSIKNVSMIATYNENSDIIKYIRWVSTLDTRTSPICRALDGKIWELSTGRYNEYSKYKPIGHKFSFPGPTAHWNCRSTQVPVLRDPADIGLKVNKVPEDVRASMGGPVPETTNYNDWLKKQSITRQKDILGPGKYRLWKNNNLDQTDLLDFRTNRPFTIEQLEAKYE